MERPTASSAVPRALAGATATLACLVLTCGSADAQSDFHSGAITRVAVNPANTILATASEDKTVRLRQLPGGRLLRTIKAPSKAGEHGKVYALAFSPDGKQLAFGGYTGQKNGQQVEDATRFDYEIYLHDVGSGRRVRTLDVPGIVDDLSWSPSGEYLVATISEMLPLTRDDVASPSEALRLFRAPDYARVDTLQGRYAAAVARHDRGGRITIVGKPGGSFSAQILDADWRELESRRFDGTPAAIDMSPDGSAVAITTLFSQLSVHTTTDLSAVYKEDFRSGPHAFITSAERATVAWSSDGRWLYFADRTTCSDEGCAIRKWDARSWTSYIDIRVAAERVTDLAPLAAGGVAFGTAGAAFGIIDERDRRVLFRERPAASRHPSAPPRAAAGLTRDEYWTQCTVPGTGGFAGEPGFVRGKYLYIDRSGAAVLTPPVDYAGEFTGGLARVRVGDLIGYLDRSGRFGIPPQYPQAGDFSEGRAWVASDDLIGYIDRTGSLVIPARYANAGAFSGGLAPVREYRRSHYGYINVLGETVIPPKFESAGGFRDGLAAVQAGGRWGYIDTRGNWVITPRFESALPFSDGLAAVRVGECTSGRCTQIIDRSGAVVIRDVELADFRSGFSEGIAVTRDPSQRDVLIDTTGRPIGATVFQQVMPFAEGLAAVNLEGKWGYVNRQGSFTIQPRYETTLPYSEGRGRFLDGGLWGYVDPAGEVVISARFHGAGAFSAGLAPVCVSAAHLASIALAPPRSAETPIPPSEDSTASPIPRPRPLRMSEADERRVASLNETTASLLAEGRYRDARQSAEQSLAIVELGLWREDEAGIQPLWDLGRIHHALGTYRALAGGRTAHALGAWREARGVLERALALVERYRGRQHPDATAIADELSDVLASLGEFDLAMDMKQRVRAAVSTTPGAGSLAALKAGNDLEILRVEKLLLPEFGKKLSTALPLALEQLRRAQETLGAEHINVAKGLVSLARAYGSSSVGVRGAAIELYQRALTLYSAAGLDGRQHALAVRAAIARLYIEAREYAPAERAFAALSRAADSVLGADDEAVVELWSERGFALRESGQLEAASGFFTRALSFWETRLESERTAIHDVRRALERLADTRRFMRDYLQAEQLYQRILESRDRDIVMHWSNAARVFRKLGTSQRLRGDLAAAKRTLENVLALLAPHLSPPGRGGLSAADVISSQALQELAVVAAGLADLGGAEEFLRRAAPLDDRMFWFLPSERDLLDAARERFRSRYYHLALTMVTRHFRTDSEWITQAYELVLGRKAITLDLQAAVRGPATPASDRIRRRREELAQVRSDLARTLVRGPEAMTPSQYAETVTLLFERAMALEGDAAGVPAWDVAADRRRVTPAEVAGSLPRDTAVIEFVRVRDDDPASTDSDTPVDEQAIYLAFVLTPSGELSLVDLGAARPIDLLAGDLQTAVRSGGNPALTNELLHDLHRLVWTPLAPSLEGVQQVMVSPDGELHRVPFAALVDEADRFLIERFRFAYVATGRDLVKPQGERNEATLDLAVVADPDFGQGGAYPALPGTAMEAEQIPLLVPGDRGRRILRGSEATETAFKELPPARILHLATHGFFLDRETFGLRAEGVEHALVKSGLVLAGANRPGPAPGTDDGLLTALEVSGMDLSATDLVVLSSCDSGAGSTVQGQGVLGLRRAFSLAGARSMLMSLWPVNDASTAQMMIGFYRNMATLPKAAALHQAQLDVIATLRAQTGDAPPRLWAAFVLEGADP